MKYIINKINLQSAIAMLTLTFLLFHVTSCKKKDNRIDEIVETKLEIRFAKDVPADVNSKGLYTFYNLKENQIVSRKDSATTNWDLAFRGTSILINSGTSGPGKTGAIVTDAIFEEILSNPKEGYLADQQQASAISSGTGNSWYTYTSNTPPAHAILPIAGKVILLKTTDEKYAKLEIQSYYMGNPAINTNEFINLETRPEGRYYNFKFVYQSNGTTKF